MTSNNNPAIFDTPPMDFLKISQAKQAQRYIDDGLEALKKLEEDPRVGGNGVEWNKLLDELAAFRVSPLSS